MKLFPTNQNLFTITDNSKLNLIPSSNYNKKESEDNTRSSKFLLHKNIATETGKSPTKENEFEQEITFLRKTRNNKKKCFKCVYDDCNFASYFENELSTHIELHKEVSFVFNCTPCKMKFLSEENFEKHKQRHLKDSKKLVGCEFPGCNKKYTTIYNRDIHFRKHTGETPFKCHLCDRAYYERANFKYHLRTGHVDIPATQKMCQHPNCQNNFKSLKTKLLHHSKFEPECEREKGILFDLLGKFKSTVENLMSKFNIEEASLKDVAEYQSLNQQFEETSFMIINREHFFTATGDKIKFV